jgi:hypothetical protein
MFGMTFISTPNRIYKTDINSYTQEKHACPFYPVGKNRHKAGSLKMKTALEYSTRVVQEGGHRCKKSTLNDLVHLTPLRIPLMNPPKHADKEDVHSSSAALKTKYCWQKKSIYRQIGRHTARRMHRFDRKEIEKLCRAGRGWREILPYIQYIP